MLAGILKFLVRRIKALDVFKGAGGDLFLEFLELSTTLAIFSFRIFLKICRAWVSESFLKGFER